MTSSSVEDDIPTPSRAVILALFGVILIVVAVLGVILITPRDSPPGVGGPFDTLEKSVADTYGVSDVVYVSPATGTLELKLDGALIRCFAPTEAELSERKPLICTGGRIINAK